jgi:hypothetical protein
LLAARISLVPFALSSLRPHDLLACCLLPVACCLFPFALSPFHPFAPSWLFRLLPVACCLLPVFPLLLAARISPFFSFYLHISFFFYIKTTLEVEILKNGRGNG